MKFIPRTPQQKEWIRIADKFILDHLPPNVFNDGSKFRGRMRSLIYRHVEQAGRYPDYGTVLFICAHFWINHFKRDWESYKITRSETTRQKFEILERENLLAHDPENSDLFLSDDRKDHLNWNYIVVMQNNSKWDRLASIAAEEKNFGKFRRLCGSYIFPLSEEQNERLNPMEWAHIVFELWHDLGGKPEQCLTDPGTLPRQYAYLVNKTKPKDIINDAFCEYANTISTLEHPENIYIISQKEHNMNTITTNPSAAIETKIVIFGQDASTMSEQQLIDAIKRVEGDIAKLKEVKTKSKKIAANIYDLETQLNAIVTVLDER